jgi:hexosaminidase
VEGQPRSPGQIKALGLKDEHELQSWFIQRVESISTPRPPSDRLGRDPRRRPGAQRHGHVLARVEGAVAAAKARATTRCWRPTSGALSSTAARAPRPTSRRPGQDVSLKDVYAFDAAPAAVTSRQRKHILGVQANVFTEHMQHRRPAGEDDLPAR